MSDSRHDFDALIFDIDNVLIDTRQSYLEAIRWTVEIFLTWGTIPFFSREKKSSEPSLLTLDDVESFKLLGGFNDDWDCCYGLLVYLLNVPVKTRTIEALRGSMDIAAFAKKNSVRPFGVSGMTKIFERPASVTIEKISRIFQEVYLGKELFQATERKKAVYWKKKGLIHKESLIFKRPLLEKLKSLGMKLGIATGRPRFEAFFSLKAFGVLDLFDHLTTMDEVKKAEREQGKPLRKPHPFSLLETAQKLAPAGRFAYIGDLPDDMMAARQAQKNLDIRPVAFTFCAKDRKKAEAQMREAGAEIFIEKPADLLGLKTQPA